MACVCKHGNRSTTNSSRESHRSTLLGDMGQYRCVIHNRHNIIIIITRKRFSEKPIVALTNNTVFILACVVSCLAFSAWTLKKVSCQEASA